MREKQNKLEGLLLGVKKVARGIALVARKVKSSVYDDFDKSYWVDSFTGYSFWAPMMTLNEVYFQELIGRDPLSWKEVGLARIVGLATNLAINKPVMKLRDTWQERVFKVRYGQVLKEKVADLSLALPIIVGLYSIPMASVADDFKQFVTMVGTGALIQLSLAFTYLPIIKRVREKFGTTPKYARLQDLEKQDLS